MTTWLQMVPWRKSFKNTALECGSEIFCFEFTVLPKMAIKWGKKPQTLQSSIDYFSCLERLSMNMY